jgi:hypothetical protein
MRAMAVVVISVLGQHRPQLPRGVPEVGLSCCVLILVDQATKDIAATQPT